MNRTVLILVFMFIAISGLLIVPLGNKGSNTPNPVKQSLPGPYAYFDHILVIYMENKNVSNVIGSPNAPYETILAHDYAYSSNWLQVSNNGSEPEYLAAISGNPYDKVTDPSDPWGACNNQPSKCPSWPAGGETDPTLAQRFESAGIPWKAYMEGATQNCQQKDTGQYATRHNPWVWFNFSQPNAPDCSKIVPLGSTDNPLLSDLNSTSAPNFMWLTPNTVNDMTTGSTTAAQVQAGDAWLAGFLPQVLSSYTFKNTKALVAILWDEGSGAPYVMPAIFAG